MILTHLRDYIIANPHCTKAQLLKGFSLSDDGLDAMLSVWVKKGRLKIITMKEVQKTRYIWLENNEFAIRLL